ncbi:PREDICTED: transcription factor Sox-10-like [Eufriesea mexicana]|uniref:transcription factor Sox-10-like n=1 Tax=Eufriesea mexicana TaxID=516756 RepID=UPI00083BACC3|nr:PREDICTED: transcription factor Sox-10-like [Eufriesea mexicana]
MDASELILNLVQKAAIKTEVKGQNLSNCELFSNRDDNPFPRQDAIVKNSFPCDVSEKSCGDCKKEKSEGGVFKVSLTTTDEDLENDKENVSRKKIRVEARQICSNREKNDEEKIFVLQQLGRSQIRPEGFPAFLCIDGRIADSNGVKRKIPRPANAFMLFANEWRKKLAAENPRESNKDISVRLGILWKNMAKDMKEKYFALAREVDAEHKRKYPES